MLALLSESTNIERKGYTQSEREIGDTFEHCFTDAPGRIIVATFASNVYRIQQISDVARRHGRVLCFQGRSMEQVVQIARNYGYLSIPDECIVPLEKLETFPDKEICVMTTGSQGEPMSGLFRMATSTHKLNIRKNDTVIISASAIPGNEKGVARVINQLYEKGCSVIYDQMADVHVSGHACKEELRLMLAITKPKFFIPIHGEFRHLLMHSKLAEEMGIQPDHIFQLSIGDVLELSNRKGEIVSEIPSGSIMVDGLGDIDDVIIRDRLMLSRDGVFVIIITLRGDTGELLCDPEIVSRGFIYMKTSDELIERTVQEVKQLSVQFSQKDKSQYSEINNQIKSRVKSLLRSETHRSPIIISMIQEVE